MVASPVRRTRWVYLEDASDFRVNFFLSICGSLTRLMFDNVLNCYFAMRRFGWFLLCRNLIFLCGFGKIRSLKLVVKIFLLALDTVFWPLCEHIVLCSFHPCKFPYSSKGFIQVILWNETVDQLTSIGFWAMWVYND